VQIIVETHSDHFLNGVRVATKNKVIAPDKSQIYFFEKQKDSLDTAHIQRRIIAGCIAAIFILISQFCTLR
jgi:predicted ATPase